MANSQPSHTHRQEAFSSSRRQGGSSARTAELLQQGALVAYTGGFGSMDELKHLVDVNHLAVLADMLSTIITEVIPDASKLVESIARA